jgi:putative glycosyltransferase (TIGR04348 family)
LRALGHRVAVQVKWDRSGFDAMIALHARRSHDSIAAWKRAHPERRLALVLTGTDLYRDIRTDATARASLDLADRLVVLQAKGLDELRAAHRAKATVIHQSVRTPLRREPPQGYFLVTVLGHLREEKDPFCAARALARLPDTDRMCVVHLGKAMSAEASREARARMRADPRYRWLGEVPHSRAMRWLARSHAMVISSRMEGGAHVVSEAIAIGVPVIASAIPGNAGLLGTDYPGYYPAGDERALAALLARAEREPAFLSALARKVKARRALVKPAAERRALRALLGKLQVS